MGRKTLTLLNEQKEPGYYNIVWNAETISSGIYFIRLSAGNFVQTQKSIIVEIGGK